jgi:hypothetical protein
MISSGYPEQNLGSSPNRVGGFNNLDGRQSTS